MSAEYGAATRAIGALSDEELIQVRDYVETLILDRGIEPDPFPAPAKEWRPRAEVSETTPAIGIKGGIINLPAPAAPSFPQVGERVKIVRGEFSGKWGTVVRIHDPEPVPLDVQIDGVDLGAVLFTPDEVKSFAEFHGVGVDEVEDEYDTEGD